MHTNAHAYTQHARSAFAYGEPGFCDGTAKEARLNHPWGIGFSCNDIKIHIFFIGIGRISGSLGRAFVAGLGDNRDKGSIVCFLHFVGELDCMCVCVCVRAHSIRFSM